MKVELFKSESGLWFFRIKSGNGQIVCQSEGYVKKDSALKTIHKLMENLSDAELKVLG